MVNKNMRVVLMISLLALVATPIVGASHTGPCTHEPVDAALAIKENGLAGVGSAAGSCAQRALDEVPTLP